MSRLRAVVGAACVGSLVAGFACGGTTGHEGLSAGGEDASMAADTTLDLDSGAFDVPILYADRVLPDLTAPPDAAGDAEAGYPWPNCPPFRPVDDPDRDAVALAQSDNELATAYDDAGGILLAPEGSACAEYPWLGSVAVDGCLTSTSSGSNDFVLLPPCNECVDAGSAAAGLRQGQSRYDICLDLYACIVDSGCGQATGSSAAECLCGPVLSTCSVDAGGPCARQELDALEYSAISPDVLKNFTNTAATAADFLGFCGSNLNFALESSLANGCFALLDAGAGD